MEDKPKKEGVVVRSISNGTLKGNSIKSGPPPLSAPTIRNGRLSNNSVDREGK
jgi:hypothetical protein